MEDKYVIVTKNKSVYFLKWVKPILGKPKMTMDLNGKEVEVNGIGKGEMFDVAQDVVKHGLSPNSLKEGNKVHFTLGDKKHPEFHKTSEIVEVYQKRAA